MKRELEFGNIIIPASSQVRVSTLNLMNTPDRITERTDLLCRQLERTRPDVMCLQEVSFDLGGGSLQLKKLAHAADMNIVYAGPQAESRSRVTYGNAILSSLKVLQAGQFSMRVPTAPVRDALYAVLETESGNALIVITAHLAWGGGAGRDRMTQVSEIDSQAERLQQRFADMNPTVVLAGDFNALPDADVLRFLRGSCAGVGSRHTYWVDAWEATGNSQDGSTVTPSNHWARETAGEVGIEIPSLLPARRIDYVLSRGWGYGRRGGPLSTRLDYYATCADGFTASDHFGVTADFWIE